MDARDRLRQYLEQRRELGESEFVLDSLSVEDALRTLGLQGSLPAAQPRDASAPAPAAPTNTESAARRAAAEEAAAGGNWRDTLKAIGVEKGGAKPPDAVRRSDVEVPAVRRSAVEGTPPPEQKPRLGRYEMPTEPSAPAESAAPDAGLVIGDRTPSPLSQLQSLGDVAKAVAACTGCSLHASARNPVPGEGNPNAGFVIVGEAPGAEEDATGRPFVGQSGQLLEKIIGAIGFTREDVFICNVLKHRPPGNRNPAPDEIAACSPYLLRQLELLQPRVILALGTFAAQTLLQTDLTLGKLRGQIHRYYGVPLIVTYHPAALLRNPNWKRPTWEDVQLARRIFDSASPGA